MTQRRFIDKADLDPSAVTPLAPSHPAMIGNRTLFPTTVAVADERFAGRLLVSGRENRKLGETIVKGKFKGYSLYQLSLEERATCPKSCDARSFCYGNAMHMARRHRIDDMDYFHKTIEAELSLLLAENPTGVMVRLHVLGDFPSVEYVAMWADLLADHDRLACFGYTHWTRDDDIGLAIDGLKTQYPERFRIRWSSARSKVDGATIIDYMPPQDHARTEEGILCPGQRKENACCASCALCWDSPKDTIVFIKHGMKSFEHAARMAQRSLLLAPAEPAAAISPPSNTPVPARSDLRPISPIPLPPAIKPVYPGEAPEIRMVQPSELKIEPRYQRDLSGKSISLIRKIVAGFDWAKFKPPVCAETADGLMVIDGQHTAIAAASHPKVLCIPVLVVEAPELERRADSFVSHNRDRIAMSPFQILHAEAAAGGKDALAILEIANRVGAFVPRAPSPKGTAKSGEIAGVTRLREILHGSGPDKLERIIRIAVMASCAPITTTIVVALRFIVVDPFFASTAKLQDSHIADALHSIKDFERAAQTFASDTGQSRYRAAAILIADTCEEKAVAA